MIIGLLGACSVAPSRPSPETVASSKIIYVVRRGWHVDVGFAAADLGESLAPLRAQFPGAQYFILGFGDRYYLLSRGKNSADELAALWPGSGLILVTGLTASPQNAFGTAHVVEVPVFPDQMAAAQTFVANAFALRGDRLSAEAPGPYAGSLFFSATLKYSAFYTCNTWAADALRSAGLPVASNIQFAGQLWGQVRRLNGAVSAGLDATPPTAPASASR